MAACDIQISSSSLLERIENFMGDASYREVIENSANYNTRLCIERRLRMPFLDSQTGVAQNHSNLFMSSRERIPGLLYGQVYTYPSKRWRKRRRQYLMQPQIRRNELPTDGNDLHTITTIENPATVASEDSKDGSTVKDDSSTKDAWYYDELELQAMEGFDDVDPDSDYDYEETYSKRRKKRGGGKSPGRGGSTPNDSPHPKKGPKGTGVGRGRKKGMNYSELTDSEKPFSCDICGARYKTRPGLTYHYTHSHKDGGGRGGVGGSGGGGIGQQQQQASGTTGVSPPPSGPLSSQQPQPHQQLLEDEPQGGPGGPQAPLIEPAPPSPHVPPHPWPNFANQPSHDGYLNYLNAPGMSRRGGRHAGPPRDHLSAQMSHQEDPSSAIPPTSNSQPPLHHGPPKPPLPLPGPSPEQVLVMEQNEKERANPSPYCDFCLGDTVSNKKSGQPEELVSCSDCGRSGHPSCLLFTENMIVSVRKYRWQCIECKCCSLCGTSDNDDQLLFCDDCDRGYHMYCLIPPLSTPPEGSWSCRTCIRDFHGGVVPQPK